VAARGSAVTDDLILPIRDELAMRSWHRDDAAALHALIVQNAAHLREWLTWVDTDSTKAGRLAFIDRCRSKRDSGESLELSLTHSDRLIGAVGYVQLDQRRREGEIGYWISENSEGRGLMTAACSALVSYGFDTLGLHRQLLRAAVGNVRSRAVAERLGFTFEGVERESELLNGEFVDLARYGLLEDERPTSSQVLPSPYHDQKRRLAAPPPNTDQ